MLVPSLGDWRQHLHQLFAAHGILHDSFIQSEVRRLIDLAAVGGSHLALGDMEKVLQTEANTFGPEGKYWMETKKGQLAVRRTPQPSEGETHEKMRRCDIRHNTIYIARVEVEVALTPFVYSNSPVFPILCFSFFSLVLLRPVYLPQIRRLVSLKFARVYRVI